MKGRGERSGGKRKTEGKSKQKRGKLEGSKEHKPSKEKSIQFSSSKGISEKTPLTAVRER